MLVKFSREGVKALEDFCHNGRVGDGGVRYIVKTEIPKKDLSEAACMNPVRERFTQPRANNV